MSLIRMQRLHVINVISSLHSDSLDGINPSYTH
nr:MAG TPA: hypothetical protein [Caudoviricetes sp.]